MTRDHGRYVWYDAMTTDVTGAAEFYKQVIGWEAQDSGMADRTYLVLTIGGIGVGGLMPIPAEAATHGARPMWMGYIDVDDVDEYAAKVRDAGGMIPRGPEDIPTVGRFAVATDPHGATFVLFKGIGPEMPVAAPGAPGHIGWAELHAGDLATAWPFYEALFGWTTAGEVDMGSMGVYRMFATGPGMQEGAIPIGGMMTKMPETPTPMWLYYFNVDSAEAAIARATAAGATLLMGPHEVPGGQWIAQFFDPQGAMFAVVSATR